MDTFPGTKDELPIEIRNNLRACRKKPVTVYATQLLFPFGVQSLEGNYKQGKPGDYLMVGIRNEVYIQDKEIFEEAYTWKFDDNEVGC